MGTFVLVSHCDYYSIVITDQWLKLLYDNKHYCSSHVWSHLSKNLFSRFSVLLHGCSALLHDTSTRLNHTSVILTRSNVALVLCNLVPIVFKQRLLRLTHTLYCFNTPFKSADIRFIHYNQFSISKYSSKYSCFTYIQLLF